MQKTIRTEPDRPVLTDNKDACLIKIYPTDADMGKRYPLGDQSVLIGRDMDCDLSVDDTSVSRKHAIIRPDDDGYHAADRKSTNGTYVNDASISEALLKDGDYLRVGSTIFRFLSGGNVEAEYHQVIYQLTIIDALTEVHNKRSLMEFLGRELVRSARHNRPLTLVMLDIDHFKSINDRRGHLCGDYALREMAAGIKATIRQDEMIARYGGEEFAVVLPETGIAGAVDLAERLRQLVEKHTFQFEDESFSLTISLGIAATQGDENMTSAKLIQTADEKLYEAKRLGRNRTVS